MEEAPLVPPSLSTHQTDDTFSFQKIENNFYDRSIFFGPDFNESSDLVKEVKAYYSIEKLVEFFEKHKEYRRITLQFPDQYILDSPIISQALEEAINNENSSPLCEVNKSDQGGHGCCGKVCSNGDSETERRVWLLADTSYSPCCVDEVASEHVGGDIVVHFGDACLTPVQNLPVLYVFGKPYLNLQAVVEEFKALHPNADSHVCLMADAPYSHHMRSLCLMLESEGYSNLIYADINPDVLGESAVIVDSSNDNGNMCHVFTLDNRNFYSTSVDQAIESDEQLNEKYSLFHITMPEDPRLLFLTTKFHSVSIYEPRENKVTNGPFPSMMRRYRYMHVARTAATVGILVNTLSLRNTREMMNTLINLIRRNDKKHYMFVVGKPNVAKLANFEPVDVWCILGCSQSGIIIDQQNEYFKPIITPYELTLALSPEVVWTNQWFVNFEQIIGQIQEEAQNNIEDSLSNETDTSDDNHAPEFDAVTGRYVSNSRPLRNVDHLELELPSAVETSKSSELVKTFSSTLTIRNTVSTSAAHLQSRQWAGLGSDYRDDNYEEEGATVEDGLAGVARGYQHDRKRQT